MTRLLRFPPLRLVLIISLVIQLFKFLLSSWSTPRTWIADEIPTADVMNEHIRDQLNYLNLRPSDSYEVNEASDYTISTTTWTDIDATDLALTIETNGGDVMIGFFGTVAPSADNVYAYFDLMIDGARVAGDDGLLKVGDSDTGNHGPVSFVYLKRGLTAGSHTFKMQWRRTGAGSMTIYAGAGTSNGDLHPQFWVKEV